MENLKTELIKTATIIKDILNTDHSTYSEDALFAEYKKFKISLKKIHEIRDLMFYYQRNCGSSTELENLVMKYYYPTCDLNALQLRINFGRLCYRVNKKTFQDIEDEMNTKLTKPITF